MRKVRLLLVVGTVWLLSACASLIPGDPGDSTGVAIGTVQLTAQNFDWNDGQFNGTHDTGIRIVFRNMDTYEEIDMSSRSGIFAFETAPNTRYQFFRLYYKKEDGRGGFTEVYYTRPQFIFDSGDHRVINLGHIDWFADQNNDHYPLPGHVARFAQVWDRVAAKEPESEWLEYSWHPVGTARNINLVGLEPPQVAPDLERLSSRPQMHIEDVQIDRIFPVLFKYYDENPIGSLEFINTGRQTMRDLKVMFNAPGVMNTAKVSGEIERLEYGQRARIDLYALFNEEVLKITEDTLIGASIDIEFNTADATYQEQIPITLPAYDRNALRWDDDEKIAGFVTAKDSEILRLSNNTVATVRPEVIPGLPNELQMAMAQFVLLQQRGVAYVIDPTSSYAQLSADTSAVDYVRFPRQTLLYRAGDCDDLSVTYSALLESVGVETAFITIPGHIYSAFRIKSLTASEIAATFANRSDFVQLEDGSIWVPVEVTMLADGFLRAWSTGARQWRENLQAGTARLIPTQSAWETYRPVAFTAEQATVPSPDEESVLSGFTQELRQFVSEQLYNKGQNLLERLEQNPDDHRVLNRLGVLYARYGRLPEARSHFESALEINEYGPALVNLANLWFMEGSFERASELYNRAIRIRRSSAAAHLGAARAAHALEQFALAEEHHRHVTEIDPEVAARFSYLNVSGDETGSARAGSEAQSQLIVVWEEAE